MEPKTIVITGASCGFGKAMTETFAVEGHQLILVARNAERLDAVADYATRLGARAISVCGDVTKSDVFERVIDAANDFGGAIDVLINNAGGGIKVAPVEAQTEMSIRDCLALNLESAINACRVIVPRMKTRRRGLIINIASACARLAWPEWSVYSAAKAGLAMFSRCLYAEARAYGVAVTVIYPGASNTSFQQNADLERFDWDEAIALRPEHIAAAVKSVVNMPRGGVVPEMVVYGQAQDITPF